MASYTKHGLIKTRKFSLISLHNQSTEDFLNTIYPKAFLSLVSRIGEVMQTLPVEAFQKTSNKAIKGLINQEPGLKVPALHDRAMSFDFNSRSIWVATINCFHAHRNKRIRDQALKILAIQLSNREVIKPNTLITWFQGKKLPTKLLKLLHKNLNLQLELVFPNWQGIEIQWHFFLNMLQQIKNLTCKALPEASIIQALESILEPNTQIQTQLATQILTKFQDNPQNHSIEEYMVSLLHRKLQGLILKYCKKIWNIYFSAQPHLKWKTAQKQKQQVNPRVQARIRQQSKPKLKGLQAYIYEYLANWVKLHPKSRHLTDVQLWQQLTDPQTKKNQLKEHLRPAIPSWQQLMNEMDMTELITNCIPGVVSQIMQKFKAQPANPQTEEQLQHKQKLFTSIHRATPLQSFAYPVTGTPTLEQLRPVLLEFLTTRFSRQAESIIRTTLVKLLFPKIETIMQTTTSPQAQQHPTFVNRKPVFQNPGFSLAMADNQMYELDLDNKEFSLKFTGKTRGQPAIKFEFRIKDTLTRHDKKRGKQPRLDQFQLPNWKVLNPTVAYNQKRKSLELHLPFEQQKPQTDDEKEQVKAKRKRMVIKDRKKEIQEIVIGIDQGLDTYAVVSAMLVKSIYQKPDETEGQQTMNKNKVLREIIRTEGIEPYQIVEQELAHYFIDDVETLDCLFDRTTGTFNNGNYNQHTDQFQKRKSCSTRGKGKLRFLFNQLGIVQSKLNKVMEQHPLSYQTMTYYQNLKRQQSKLWAKHQQVLDAIKNGVAAKIRDIAMYFDTTFKQEHPEYQHCPVRVQVEDLRWTQFSSRKVVGAYLAQNQIRFFFSQLQTTLGRLLKEHHIGLWRVDPRNSSQTCALCNYYTTNQRKGKNFRCRNPNHRNMQNKSYTCHADLNASRNLALWPPRSLRAINL